MALAFLSGSSLGYVAGPIIDTWLPRGLSYSTLILIANTMLMTYYQLSQLHELESQKDSQGQLCHNRILYQYGYDGGCCDEGEIEDASSSEEYDEDYDEDDDDLDLVSETDEEDDSDEDDSDDQGDTEEEDETDSDDDESDTALEGYETESDTETGGDDGEEWDESESEDKKPYYSEDYHETRAERKYVSVESVATPQSELVEDDGKGVSYTVGLADHEHPLMATLIRPPPSPVGSISASGYPDDEPRGFFGKSVTWQPYVSLYPEETQAPLSS